MRLVVLAAGRGERCWPLTTTRPKPLLPVANEPLVERLLRQAATAGVDEATVVVRTAGDDVDEAVRAAGERIGVPVETVEQGTPRGTGHALASAGPFDDPFLAVNGDVFLSNDAFGDVLSAPGDAVVSTALVDDAASYGHIEVDGDRFLGVDEKSTSGPGPVNAGVYRLPIGFHEQLAGIGPSERGEIEITDALNALVADKVDVRTVGIDQWSDVGWPWDLLEANVAALADLDPGVHGTVEDGAVLSGPVHVAEGATVRSGAVVEGPVLIGPGATVGPNCYVRGATVLGRDAKVGHACEVKNSVLMEGAKVPHLSYIGDSILGRHVNLGAGTVVANLRHDDRNVHSIVQRGRVDTGRRKFGVVLGDGAKTGINATLNVGVCLDAGEMVGPGETVSRTRSVETTP